MEQIEQEVQDVLREEQLAEREEITNSIAEAITNDPLDEHQKIRCSQCIMTKHSVKN